MASERSGNPDVNGGQVRPPWRCSPDVPRRSRGGGVVLPSGRARRYTAQVAEAGSTRVLDLRLPSPVEELHDDVLARHAITLFLKRDDMIHPEIPGNKWRKLKYNLAAVEAGGHGTVLTFGGAYSNHIRAVAAASYYYDFSAIGVIRGEEHVPLNPSLAYAVSRGMLLVYMDRA